MYSLNQRRPTDGILGHLRNAVQGGPPLIHELGFEENEMYQSQNDRTNIDG